jgi:hypothetical protein
VLHCPKCGEQHIDKADDSRGPIKCQRTPECREPCGEWCGWTNPPHRSHLCAGCGHIWRPADVPTNGVAATKTKGRKDSPPVTGRDPHAEKDKATPGFVSVPRDLLAHALDPEAGFILNANNGPRGSESTECTGCGVRNYNGWHEHITHRDGCTYERRQTALAELRGLLKTSGETTR